MYGDDMNFQQIAAIATVLYHNSLESAYRFFGEKKLLHINHTRRCESCPVNVKTGPQWCPTFKFNDRPVTVVVATEEKPKRQIGFYPVMK